MGFEIEVAEILAKARKQARTPPTAPIVPTAGAPEGQTVGTIGTVGLGRASDSTDSATLADDLRDAFEERAAIIHEAHTIIRATDGTLLPEPNFTLTRAEAALPLWAWAGGGGFDVAEDFVCLHDNHPKAYVRIGHPRDEGAA